MQNFIVFFKNGDIQHSAGYTPMLRRLEGEGKVKGVIDISNPTEPKVIRGDFWRKLFSVG